MEDNCNYEEDILVPFLVLREFDNFRVSLSGLKIATFSLLQSCQFLWKSIQPNISANLDIRNFKVANLVT